MALGPKTGKHFIYHFSSRGPNISHKIKISRRLLWGQFYLTALKVAMGFLSSSKSPPELSCQINMSPILYEFIVMAHSTTRAMTLCSKIKGKNAPMDRIAAVGFRKRKA